MYSPGFPTLPGLEDRRSADYAAVISIAQNEVPSGFPMVLWGERQSYYRDYWAWFRGDHLNERRTKDEKAVLKYPLGINPVRNFARKHAAVLLGEDPHDSPDPLIRTVARPNHPLVANSQDSNSAARKELAETCENIVNEVWRLSGGRALQTENATLSQFLGGCVFQVSWQPDRKDLRIPVVVRNIMPDFFLPSWRADDFWNLLEAYVVYRIPVHVAERMYGFDAANLPKTGWVTYTEHWTEAHYSVYLNGKPIQMNGITYERVENVFGFVPFVYIPHLREGSFWGSSIVEDIRGLVREMNARYADIGDHIRKTVHRKRYMRDVEGQIKPRQIDRETWANDLGRTSVTTKAKPEIFTEDPSPIPDGVIGFTQDLWVQLLREGAVSEIEFGEDEGSQRSGVTLAIRMWPTTSHARMERTFWTDGLNQVAKFILKMVAVKGLIDESGQVIKPVPQNFERLITISQSYYPQIPNDRKQLVDEIIMRFQAGLISIETAMEQFGDIPYIEEEITRIREWLEFTAKLSMEAPDSSQFGEGAATETTTPTASSDAESEE